MPRVTRASLLETARLWRAIGEKGWTRPGARSPFPATDPGQITTIGDLPAWSWPGRLQFCVPEPAVLPFARMVPEGRFADTEPAKRDYPQLFRAMTRAIESLLRGDDDESALRESFTNATTGFGARKALLLRVDATLPLVLRNLLALGLTPQQIEACQVGESAPGVSSSLIREALAEGRAIVRQDPRQALDPTKTASHADGNYSAIAAPILDPYTDRPLAILYLQTPEFPEAYTESDVLWLDSYTKALGLAYGSLLHQRRKEQELAEVVQSQRPENAPDLIGDDPATLALKRELLQSHIPAASAPHPYPLLILGEKGTGKELVARFIHAYSERRRGAFVAINCAELTDEMAAARFFGHVRGSFTGALRDEPGLFRSADKGVLFLDEIGHLTRRAQAVLLGVLENHLVQPVGGTRHVSVDVMLVLATNREVEDPEVRETMFLEDFYDRIAPRAIQLAPLRTRAWDILPLAEHFRESHEKRMRKRTLGFAPDALRALASYAWPGNVRELSRVCDLLVSVTKAGERIDRAFLVKHYPKIAKEMATGQNAAIDLPLREATRAFQKQLILTRLEAFDGDVTQARHSLQLPWTTMKRYLRTLRIDAKAVRDGLPRLSRKSSAE